MNRSLLLVLPILLAACSSTPTTKVIQPSQQFGDKTPLLSVVGVATIGNDPTRAVQVAKADAAASVVRFMAMQVRSSSEITSKTDDNITIHNGFNRTSETAASMIRGLVFEEEVQEGDRVLVRGVVSLESINRARYLQGLMK